MLRIGLCAAFATACLGAAAPAWADGDIAPAKDDDGQTDGEVPGEPTAPEPSTHHDDVPTPGKTYYHGGQFGLSMRLPFGFRAIAPYDGTDYCGVEDSMTQTHNAAACVGRAPFSFDFDLSYGITRRIEAFLEIRLGVEKDFAPSIGSMADGPRVHHFSPGIRWFFNEAFTSKLFTTAQVFFDTTDYLDGGGAARGADVGVRNMSGLWFDPSDRYGVYVFVGEQLSVARWVDFELEAGIGVQARILE